MRRVLKSFARVLCCWGDDRERVDSEKIGSRQDRWCSKEQGTVLRRTLVQIPPVQGGRKQGDGEEKKESWGPPLASAKEKDSDLLNRQVHSRLTYLCLYADINTCALTHIAKKLQIYKIITENSALDFFEGFLSSIITQDNHPRLDSQKFQANHMIS